jgi:hypothetical protein
MAGVKSALVHHLNRLLQPLSLELLVTEPHWLLRFGIDPVGVELLADPAFQASVRECRRHTLLDTARLANLWMLSRMSNPDGGVIEVGAYRGGGALHLSNALPDRMLTICDTFSGFQRYDPTLDSTFRRDAFTDTSAAAVDQLFSRKGRAYRIVVGEFPGSVGGQSLGPIAFAHVDVDVYSATIETLRYLSSQMIDRSLIILDDRHRRAEGVDKAVEQFLNEDRRWLEFPMFPAQALLMDRAWLAS